MSLFERIREAIAEQLGVAKDEIELDSRLTELGADSLDRAALQLELESEFGIEITDKEMQKLFTVRDVLRFVENEVPVKP